MTRTSSVGCSRKYGRTTSFQTHAPASVSTEGYSLETFEGGEEVVQARASGPPSSEGRRSDAAAPTIPPGRTHGSPGGLEGTETPEGGTTSPNLGL
jgi:hypothetical protein